MVEHRTDVVVSGRTEGFQRIQQDASRLMRDNLRSIREQAKGFEALSRGTQTVDQDLKQLKQRLTEIAQEQLATVRAMEEVDKGAQGYANLTKELENLEQEGAKVEKQIRLINRAFADQTKSTKEAALAAKDLAKYGFTQGLIQGVAPQLQGIQRGPGMQRQIAGLAVGTGARALASLPFTGIQGLQQGVAGVGQAISPLFAGAGAAIGVPMQLLSMGLGMGTQMAGSAMARDQARLAALTQLGIGSSAMERVRRAGIVTEDLRLQARTRGAQAALTVQPTREQMLRGMAVEGAPEPAEGIFGQLWQGLTSSHAERTRMRSAELALEGESVSARLARETAEEQARTDVAERTERQFIRRRIARRRARARGGIFTGIRGAGQELMGVSETQAIQFATQLAQIGGGWLVDLERQGLLRGGMAAQQAFGVGPGVTGAFLQAGRVGGAVGARGRGGDAMAEAIGAAVGMGLEGSELNEFLSQIAEGITSWKDTGIPINSRSIGELGGVLSMAGLGGIRGGRMAMGLRRGAAAILEGGPQSFEQLQMLRHFGGLQAGAGVGGYEQALLRLESGEGFTPENIQRMLGTFRQAGGGGAGGRLYTRQALRQLGVRLGVGEMQQLERGLFGEEGQAPAEVIGAIQTQLQAQQQRQAAPQTMADVELQAKRLMSTFGSTQRRMAAVMNKQADAGDRFKDIVIGLQATTADVTTAIGDLTAPVKVLTDAMRGLAAEMPELTGNLKQYLQGGLGSE